MINRKPLDLPMEVAKQFAKDMRRYFAEQNTIKRDEIAARQLHVLNDYRWPGTKKLRLQDVKKMFVEMREHPGGER